MIFLLKNNIYRINATNRYLSDILEHFKRTILSKKQIIGKNAYIYQQYNNIYIIFLYKEYF